MSNSTQKTPSQQLIDILQEQEKIQTCVNGSMKLGDWLKTFDQGVSIHQLNDSTNKH